MEEIIEHIINNTYQYFRQKILGKFGSSHVRFGGFRLSYNWAGRTRLSKELLGNLIIYCRTIHLNINFLHQLSSLLPPRRKYSFAELVNTLAHEIAHCLLSDYHLDLTEVHSFAHKKLTTEVEQYLWKSTEIQELERLQDKPIQIIQK